MRHFYIGSLLFVLLFACQSEQEGRGTLFIIGGGPRPPALVQELIRTSGMDQTGYAVILPMASSEPDTAAFYAQKQLIDLGISKERLAVFNFQPSHYPLAWLDSLQSAQMIYLPGGDQNRLMEIILNSPLHEALLRAYTGGATIAGTSAGAAVMSEKMITGNEFKHPEYTGDFRTIEADNLQIKQGIGFLTSAIIDQHFIYRMRMNRLITVALEYPDQTCFGIDESTALIIQGKNARVAGAGQVIRLENPQKSSRRQAGLLGGDGLRLSVFLPGESFRY